MTSATQFSVASQLCLAAGRGDISEVRAILDKGVPVDARGQDGITALMSASQQGHMGVAQLLIGRGADVNAVNNTGITGLMYAAGTGHTEMVTLLLSRGADIDQCSQSGGTALMLSSMSGCEMCVRMLLQGGADPHLRENNLLTASDWAKVKGHGHVVELLTRVGVKPDLDKVEMFLSDISQDRRTSLTSLQTLHTADYNLPSTAHVDTASGKQTITKPEISMPNTERSNKPSESISSKSVPLPSKSDELPPEPDAPSSKAVTPPSKPDALPSKSDALPSKSDALPSKSDEPPSKSDAIPSKSDALPSKSDALLPKSDTLPPKLDALPSISDALPSEPDALSSKSDALPSKSDAVPSKPDATSSKPDATSSKPDALPSKLNTSPSKRNTIPSKSPRPQTVTAMTQPEILETVSEPLTVIVSDHIQFSTSDLIGDGCGATMVFRGSLRTGPGSRATLVAVKQMLLSKRHLAEREKQLLLNVRQHQNVIKYLDMSESGQFVYITLELCTTTLHHCVLGKFPVSMEGRQTDVLAQTCRGVRHLHTVGIVHRDLKPGNILLQVFGEKLVAKVSDFDRSKKMETDRESMSVSSTAGGTSGWMAPEFLHKKHLTTSTDIFSLGCIIYFVKTSGKHAFGEDIYSRDFNVKQNDFKPHLEDLGDDSQSRSTRRLVLTSISHNPEERPTAEQLCQHFDWLLQST